MHFGNGKEGHSLWEEVTAKGEGEQGRDKTVSEGRGRRDKGCGGEEGGGGLKKGVVSPCVQAGAAH